MTRLSSKADNLKTISGSVDERASSNAGWLKAIRHYLFFIIAANLLWEILQLPLYTIWTTGTSQEIAFAIVHCTAGDVLIALSCLVGGLVLVGDHAWPKHHFWKATVITVVLGVVYTVFSEWLNLVIRKSWAYSDLMPVVPIPWPAPSPISGVGLAPLMQWIVIPISGLVSARRSVTAS